MSVLCEMSQQKTIVQIDVAFEDLRFTAKRGIFPKSESEQTETRRLLILLFKQEFYSGENKIIIATFSHQTGSKWH